MGILNRSARYAPWAVLIYVYVRVALLLTNYSVVWSQMEELNYREYVLESGIALSSEDWSRALNWQIFEYAPRSTRPLSSYMEILDTKFRAALWRVMVPHPSLSLMWIPLLLGAPWLFFKLLRNLGVNRNITVLATAMYVGNPGTLSLAAVDFRPAKPLANFAIVACLYWASRIQRQAEEGSRDLSRCTPALWAFMFLSFFVDETALLAYPAILLFFPRIAFGSTGNKIAVTLLPIATVLSYFWWIPKWTQLAGWPGPKLGEYSIVAPWATGTFRGLQLGRWVIEFPVNLRIFFSDIFGLVDPRLPQAPSYYGLLWGVLVAALVTVSVWCGLRLWATRQSAAEGRLRRAAIAFLGATIIANILLHIIDNKIWGLHWLNAYWPIFFLIFAAICVNAARVHSLALTVTVFLAVTASMLNFTYVNNAFKMFFYYRTADIQQIWTHGANRFAVPFRPHDVLFQKTREIWRAHNSQPEFREIPTELFYLAHDLRMLKPGDQPPARWTVFEELALDFDLVRGEGEEYFRAIPLKPGVE